MVHISAFQSPVSDIETASPPLDWKKSNTSPELTPLPDTYYSSFTLLQCPAHARTWMAQTNPVAARYFNYPQAPYLDFHRLSENPKILMELIQGKTFEPFS